ncbi:hypothetical protein EDB81DRAFT_760586 [Dactylonectria macrodidyma]|uniref:NACHT domain-containing protein n=1 Tax=Dactylonectria macrodidyma TaxID=307937 RepID=A0A9P9EQE1_9HYPO|nr:hypothetical protein EDB81DRAFT_760586 [Dactylonectria macrodidyma]
MTISYDDKSSDEETDLGTLCQEALIRYYEECGTDLRTLPASHLNIAHIKAEQKHQLLLFCEYRHDKGKLDRLRTLVAQNSDTVVGVAINIANTASAAFPPSAALLTAFNYVMNASRAVSEDYEMIVSFFDVMNSFLERISMLESRMPGEWQIRRFLVNVFSAMMTLSAIARKCRLKGRLSRWAEALVDGSDPKLKGAFDSLYMHLERFESAAMLTTLKHTLESGKKLDSLGQGIKQIQLAYIDRTHTWFRVQNVYSDFEVGKVRLLWVSGPAGMGKSTLAYTVVKALQDELISDATTSVAHFFFHGDSNRRFMSQMLRSCALQVAIRNDAYREDCRLNHHDLNEDQERLWELLFQTKFTKNSGRRLVFILDGVNETDEDDRKHIEMILKDISSSEHMNIQVLFTRDPGSFTPVPETKELESYEEAVAAAKRNIITRLSKQADTMRYVDHMLRTLGQLGRSEMAVLRQLNNLPSCTSGLYQIILEECQKSPTEQELVIPKKFFVWLAYTTEPLYLGCARRLLNHIATENSIDIDEELENGCNRILRLSNTTVGYDEEEYDDSDTNTDQSDDDKPVENDDDDDVGDFSVVVSFQNGLRRYFRPPANLPILYTGTVSQIDYRETALHATAVTGWTRQPQDINQAEVSEEEAACVIESICNILSNRGSSIQKM